MQNYGSVRLMGRGSRGFLPLTRKLPQIVVQRGSPHDLSRSVQNELDFALFYAVLGHQAKTCFSVLTPWVQLVTPGRTLMANLVGANCAHQVDPFCTQILASLGRFLCTAALLSGFGRPCRTCVRKSHRVRAAQLGWVPVTRSAKSCGCIA